MLWINIYFLFFSVIMNHRGESMKKFFKIIFLLSLLFLVIYFRKPITDFMIEKVIFKQGVIIDYPNDYQVDYSFAYVQETDDFYAKNKEHLKNILFTGLNNGQDTFYFYCNYDQCEQDINAIIDSNDIVGINNFLHPFNTYRRLSVKINSLRKVSVNVEKTYTQENIASIEQKIAEIMNNILTDEMSLQEKITAFHNYIIHNTKYDKEYIDSGINDTDHPSHKAIGPLFYGKALCGGYTDTMSIFLNKLAIPNYRISSEYHIWNLAQIENNWVHIDLTWDDPSADSDMLLDNFLFISTEKLQSYHTKHHTFNEEIYIEANPNQQ